MNHMSNEPPVPAADNSFERIKRVSPEGNESWSARDLARTLDYSVFRNFQPVIEKAKEACVKSGHSIADHFAVMRNMVGIGSGAQRELEDWALSRYACYSPPGRFFEQEETETTEFVILPFSVLFVLSCSKFPGWEGKASAFRCLCCSV